MTRVLLLFFCSASLVKCMNNQPDIISTMPDELIYKIIDVWPATNMYRLISTRWHTLTSYTRADDIIGKFGPASLGQWDAQKLLAKYINKNNATLAHTILARKQLTSNKGFTVEPFYGTQSPEMRQLLNNYGIVAKLDSDIISPPAFHGDLEQVQYLYNHYSLMYPNYLNIRDALHHAVSNDQIEVVTFLLSKLNPADIAKTAYYASAADRAHIDTIEKLCQKSTAHINTKNSAIISPFMQAVARGRLAVAKLLKEYGADIHQYNEQHGLPLYDACLKGRGEIVDFLLANGIKPDSIYWNANNQSLTPLWIAAQENHLEIAQKLIGAGADVNYGTQGHYPSDRQLIPTPLIQAAYKGHLQMIQLLIRAGAQIWNPQFNGKNAQETARAQGHMHIVQWLQEYGFKA